MGIEILDARKFLGNIDKPRVVLENAVLDERETSVVVDATQVARNRIAQ